MDITNKVKNKLLFNSLNLDYPIEIISYNNQTNNTITKIMNNFIEKYQQDFSNKTFILVYQDDIYSLIAYQILKNIQGLYPFTLKILGKSKMTKHDINKKDLLTYLQKKKINKSENIIYISCFNPIYKVKNSKIPFKELSKDCYCIIEKFTPLQFKIMSEFYNIKNFKLLQEFKTDTFLDFQRFTLCGGFTSQDYSNTFADLLNIESSKTIELIKLKGDETDFKIFDNIRKNDKEIICFYYFNEDKFEFLTKNFNMFISPANTIQRENSNTSLSKFFKLFPYKYIGDWSTREKKEIWSEVR